MTGEKPIAFMSYSHFDDEHDGGALTTFCQRLSGEVRVYTGENFLIFQDRKDIKWGHAWRTQVDESLNSATFIIPIITPNFFKSIECRKELEKFLEREKDLGREDLILPVYYIETPLLKDGVRRKNDKLAQIINKRQYVDWRELRFEPFDSSVARKKMASLAVQIRDALEEVVSPSPKIDEPKKHIPHTSKRNSTLIVDPMCRGDYATISEAIEAANPGDKILVGPGLYQEGLVIDKPLEIVGEGERDEIEIQAMRKSAIVFKTTNGRVANLTLRQMGGEEELYGVDIGQGRLKLEYCDISSQSEACVAIHDGADPRLRSNKIHDGQKSGVLVWQTGRGTLEDNDIFGNTDVGVRIWKNGNPTLRRNKIYKGNSVGVFVYDNGNGILEENEIFENTNSGVQITTGGNPKLRKNKIYEGKRNGILVFKNGLGIIEENEIFRNASTGVTIETGGNPTLRRNKIHDGKTHGVEISNNGQGILEENDIFGNANSGVQITTGGNPTLRRNKIHDGMTHGVEISNNGLGILEENDIFGNAYSGVEITFGGNPNVRQNRINRNNFEAVWIHLGGCGVIEYNDLRDNKRGAWDISEDSEPKVKRSGNIE
jgi:F-box protein 11